MRVPLLRYKPSVFQIVVISFSLLWILFFIKGVIALDPDFGWHIRMGELILDKGIQRSDPFSYTMASFPYVDHEWLTNILMYKIYVLSGAIGLSVFFTTLAVLSLILVLQKKLINWTTPPLLLSGAILLSFSGNRPQVITWLMLSLLINILFRVKSIKKKLFLPLFFLIWANLHGGFAIGIAVLFIYNLINFWQKKRIILIDLVVFILCVLATFINPYGIELWTEVWRSASDSSLRFTISEWQPMIFRFNMVYIAMLAISSCLILRFRKKIGLNKLTLFFIFLILGISSQRHIPLWTILTLAIFPELISLLFEEVSEIKLGTERFRKVFGVFFITSLLLFIVDSYLILISVKSTSERNYYPMMAAKFLKDQKFDGELFSTYDWGGYLDWKLPEKKVFIDGRMPSWRYSSAPKNESNYAFSDYRDTLSGKISFEEVARKYNIKKVLLPKSKNIKIDPLTSYLESLNISFLSSLFYLPDKKSFFEELEKQGWKKIYMDKIAVIYERV